MRKFHLFLLLLLSSTGISQSLQENNKDRARQFYQNLWFSNNTDKFQDYLADEYIIHDIGGEDGIIEKAVSQKEIADMFWINGTMEGDIDYQIAEGDLVATRWHWKYTPTSFFGSFLFGATEIPIINVFRFQDGRIVEIWNHRHDIDVPGRQRFFVLKGLGIGLLIALIPFIWALRLRRKLKYKS